MQKIIFILALGLIAGGCSVSRKQKSDIEFNGISIKKDILTTVREQNLTSKGFFIERAEFRITEKGEEKSAIGTVKCNGKGEYLISIKSIAGIEFARIYVTPDSVFINDRIDRKLFIGSSDFLQRKYGISTRVLPIIFGDYINDDVVEYPIDECREGKMNISGEIDRSVIEYTINCEYGKLEHAAQDQKYDQNSVKLSYGQFSRVNGIYIPEMIQIKEDQGQNVVEIRIKKITYPWNGNIEFIRGKYQNVILK